MKQTASDILDILKDPPSSGVSLEAGSTVNNAYHQIADILNRINKPEQIPPPSSIQNGATTARVKNPTISLSTPAAAAKRVEQNTGKLVLKINMAIEHLQEKFQTSQQSS